MIWKFNGKFSLHRHLQNVFNSKYHEGYYGSDQLETKFHHHYGNDIKKVTIFSPGQIKDLLNQYIIEASSGQYDYVKALAEFSSRDESALNFRKGDIIAVVPKHDAYTEKVFGTLFTSKKLDRLEEFIVYMWILKFSFTKVLSVQRWLTHDSCLNFAP